MLKLISECNFSFLFFQLCYIFRPFHEDHTGRDRFRSVPDGVEPSDLATKLHLNGDIEFGELNLRDMDPEEIRVR